MNFTTNPIINTSRDNKAVQKLGSPDKTFDFLYRSLGRRILYFILKRTGGNMEIADQVVQDTFVAAFKSYRTFAHKSTYFTWLCKISLSKLADYYRQQINAHSRLVAPALDELNSLVDPQISVEEKITLDELRSQVNNCLNLLPERYRRLLHLKYYLDLSNKEICVRLNLTQRQLEGKLYRAKQAFVRVFGNS